MEEKKVRFHKKRLTITEARELVHKAYSEIQAKTGEKHGKKESKST